uniref:Uncharacterized protein n=1 Tax=Oryza rufipogon TaxID=4529 RepID=A0A0E0MVB8_ORYRU
MTAGWILVPPREMRRGAGRPEAIKGSGGPLFGFNPSLRGIPWGLVYSHTALISSNRIIRARICGRHGNHNKPWWPGAGRWRRPPLRQIRPEGRRQDEWPAGGGMGGRPSNFWAVDFRRPNCHCNPTAPELASGSSGGGGRRAPAWPSGGGCGGRWRLVERQRLRRAAAAGRAAVGGRVAAAVEGSGGGRQALVWLSGGDCGGRRQAGPRVAASRRLAADSICDVNLSQSQNKITRISITIGLRIINHSSNNWNNMNNTRQNTWVKEDLLAMDLSSYVKKVKEAATGEGARMVKEATTGNLGESEPGGSRSGGPQPPGDRIWRPPPRGDHRRPPPILRDEEAAAGAQGRRRSSERGGAVARGWPTAGGEALVVLAAGRREEAPAEVEV